MGSVRHGAATYKVFCSKMLKIFHFGSCRTTLQCFNDDDFFYVKNYDHTHSTKEVLMYLDFFDGTKQPDVVPHLDCLMYFPENFRPEPWRQNLDDADVVVIEISSLKIFRYLDHHYQLKMVRKQDKLAIMDIYSQPLDDLAADLVAIERRLSKPIIFTGHVDLDFYDVPGVHGHIAERGQIDAVLQKNCANFISLKEVFEQRDYKTVCDFSYGEHDTHHITNASKQLLRNALVEKCRQLGLVAGP